MGTGRKVENSENTTVLRTEKSHFSCGIINPFRKYDFTKTYVRETSGVLSRTEKTYYIYRISSTEIHQTIIQRIFRVADIVCIMWGSAEDLIIRGVRNSSEIRDLLMEEAEIQRKDRGEEESFRQGLR